MTPVAGPPVPPAPPPPPLNNIKKEDHSGDIETKVITENEFVKEITELVTRWGPARGGNGNDAETILVVVTPLKTVVLQNGPMCGIVALSEALEIANSHSTSGIQTTCPKRILEEAQLKGYTKQGEMFSVQVMKTLASELKYENAVDAKVVDVSPDTSKSKREAQTYLEIVSHLLSGYPVLFPYDADFNHSPSLRKGHAAHWAVVHGLACSVSFDQLTSILNLSVTSSSRYQILQSSQEVVILKPVTNLNDDNMNGACDDSEVVKKLTELFTLENTHVISHQGKSFRSALWKYSDLLESNRNLKEVAPKIIENQEDFILHEGIVDGLCSKILLLK